MTRNLVAGFSLGTLTGALIGLSVNEVVGLVVAGLVAVLATFFGLQSGTNKIFATTTERVTSFSLAALLALLAGLYMRTNDAFAPDLIQQAEEWKAVGFNSQTAAQIVAFEHLGVMPNAWLASDASIDASLKRSSVLFALNGADSCTRLDGRHYDNLQAIVEALQFEGGIWARLAESVSSMPPEIGRQKVVQDIVEVLCEPAQ